MQLNTPLNLYQTKTVSSHFISILLVINEHTKTQIKMIKSNKLIIIAKQIKTVKIFVVYIRWLMLPLPFSYIFIIHIKKKNNLLVI